jgi:hypothetical protein
MSKPKSPLKRRYRNELSDRKGHRKGPFVSTCEAVLGYPKCMTAAAGGAHGVDCTCPPFDLETLKPVTEAQHAECERRGAEAFAERDGSPCDDCAFRPGSPEMRDELTIDVAMQKVPFRCHQGMPLRFTGYEDDGVTPRVSYEPRDQLGTTYPICNGWAFFKALEKLDGR